MCLTIPKKVMLAVLCSMGLAFTSCQSDNVLTETNQSSVRSGKGAGT